jgi:hypothetical protein
MPVDRSLEYGTLRKCADLICVAGQLANRLLASGGFLQLKARTGPIVWMHERGLGEALGHIDHATRTGKIGRVGETRTIHGSERELLEKHSIAATSQRGFVQYSYGNERSLCRNYLKIKVWLPTKVSIKRPLRTEVIENK